MSEPMEWPDPAGKAHAVEQAGRLRDKAAAGGLKFEAYLPPDLAVWLLDRIEQGKFIDPSEATFVLLGEARDLELLKRSIQAAIDDPRPPNTAEEVWQSLQKNSTTLYRIPPNGKNGPGFSARASIVADPLVTSAPWKGAFPSARGWPRGSAASHSRHAFRPSH